MCLAVIFAAAVFASAAGGYLRGDADNDGEVTILDATAIQRTLAELPVSSWNEKAADVDENGLDITDATAIQRYLVGFSDPYHIDEFFSDATLPTQDEYELPIVR